VGGGAAGLGYDGGEVVVGVVVAELNQLIASFGGVEPLGGAVFAPMSDEQVRAIEERIGRHIPDLYRNFLTTYGASCPKELVVCHPLNPLPREITRINRVPVAIFYGLGHTGDGYDLQTRLNFYAGRVPANMIPIADNGGGSQYLLALTDSEAGSVFYWDFRNEPPCEEDYMEERGKPRPPEVMLENVHLVADSFEDFLRRLEVDVH